MNVKQIYNLVNTALSESIGESAVLNEDLSNLVDMGNTLFDSSAVENYGKKLIDVIGKWVFVDRPYQGKLRSLLMDSWEWGSVLSKVSGTMPEATVNETWELVDGASYDPFIFQAPDYKAKYFNKRVTFEIDQSYTTEQLKESFNGIEQMNRFLTMLVTIVENAMTKNFENLAFRTVNNFIGETIYADYATAATSTKSGVKAVNLLYLYNQANSTTLTAEQAIKTPEFIRFAVYTMSVYADRMATFSTVFNIGGAERFTPREDLRMLLLTDFARAADVYLQSDTFHDEYTRLPDVYETVPFWQGSGTDFGFSSISSINIKSANNHTVSYGGIIGCMFDRWALGINNYQRKTNTIYNPKADFTNYFYKFFAQYFNDTDENFVVFMVA